MKYLVTLFFLVIATANGATWSNMQKSGFNQAWERTKNFTTQENEKIEQFWTDEIKPLIEKIAEQVKLKEQNLKTIKALEAEINLTDKEILFLFEKEKQLLGNEANVKGIK
ncbi:hypothetical protein [Campylobacter sp. RM16187]|uniref:hypothetical protein n=1 Tax=Campylobacter sp. RM16187 TaxID=1660063 RepID=UPI0021B5A53E|nr:hypothetical protein [Campylobacter sp. RM16187]QKG30294.1 hypothetical protein CDOMF_a045 [Campylobacter sp. RM16187]